jgi:hypothetical protein
MRDYLLVAHTTSPPPARHSEKESFQSSPTNKMTQIQTKAMTLTYDTSRPYRQQSAAKKTESPMTKTMTLNHKKPQKKPHEAAFV